MRLLYLVLVAVLLIPLGLTLKAFSDKKKLARQKAAEDQAKKQEEEKRARQREETLRQQVEALQQREDHFAEMLRTAPEASVEISSKPAEHHRMSDMGEYTFSNITKKTPRKTLGNFIALDVETTGLYPSKAEIVEVAAVRFENFEPVEKFAALCSPRSALDLEAMKVNGITPDMIEGRPRFDQIAASLQAWIGDSAIVGHNLEFDLRFLWHYGVDFFQVKRKYYDTLDIAQRTLKKIKYKYDKEFGFREPDYDADYDVEDYKLGTLCSYYGIVTDGAHRALADAYAAGRLLKCLADDRE